MNEIENLEANTLVVNLNIVKMCNSYIWFTYCNKKIYILKLKSELPPHTSQYSKPIESLFFDAYFGSDSIFNLLSMVMLLGLGMVGLRRDEKDGNLNDWADGRAEYGFLLGHWLDVDRGYISPFQAVSIFETIPTEYPLLCQQGLRIIGQLIQFIKMAVVQFLRFVIDVQHFGRATRIVFNVWNVNGRQYATNAQFNFETGIDQHRIAGEAAIGPEGLVNLTQRTRQIQLLANQSAIMRKRQLTQSIADEMNEILPAIPFIVGQKFHFLWPAFVSHFVIYSSIERHRNSRTK